LIVRSEFGKTGHRSSRTLLGAAAFGSASQEQVDACLELALEHGVNHVDTAASYGESELRIGSWIRRHGQSFFLATKTGERSRQSARDEIRRSLERLSVDRVDLIQLHNLVEPGAWDQALGAGGALEAAIEARDEGLVRFIGVTGHGLMAPTQHRRALERFAFDSVLCPFSFILWQDPDYRREVSALLDVCQTSRVAVQTIKAVVRAPWGERERTRATWYEPIEDPAEIDLAVHWVLRHPAGVFLNMPGDVNVVPKVLESAERLGECPPPEAMQAQLERLEMSPLFTQPWL
jgi:aryl-alcohol dehydrogenase-like predicted oxidoreductase